MRTLLVGKRRWFSLAGAVVTILGSALAAAVGIELQPPVPLPSVAMGMKRLDLRGLPPISRYQARDGAMLAYRAYPGSREQVVILIHGSAGQSPLMHAMAQSLQHAGATAYAVDIRGHGESGRRSDIDYIGQLDDDLADFKRYVRPAHQNAEYTLAGFSAGGAFTLRIAGGRYGDLFDRYIAIAPALTYPRGVARPNSGVWASVSVRRIAGLMVLNWFGIHRFDGLTVTRFAAPPDDAFFTSAYSYRLTMNFSPGLNYLSFLARVKKPVAVIAGADDEQFYSDRYDSLLKPVKPDIQIEIVPGVGHAGAIVAPAMLETVKRVFTTPQHSYR